MTNFVVVPEPTKTPGSLKEFGAGYYVLDLKLDRPDHYTICNLESAVHHFEQCDVAVAICANQEDMLRLKAAVAKPQGEPS